MRRMRLRTLLAFAVVFGLTMSTLQAQQTAKITSSGTGYLEYLPQDYNKNNNNYPVVIFLHGIGERGTTSTDPSTLKTSVEKVARVGLVERVSSPLAVTSRFDRAVACDSVTDGTTEASK